MFDRRNKARREYWLGIRNYHRGPTEFYSNDLHEALIDKKGSTFWKCWNAKFESCSSRIRLVDGTAASQQIADKFAKYFSEACSLQSHEGADTLAEIYKSLRNNYVGLPHLKEYDFDTDLIENILMSMKRGKAADLYGLSGERLQYSHPILCCVLA